MGYGVHTQEMLQAFGLAPLEIEGGYFAETFRSSEVVDLQERRAPSSEITRRKAGTAILYALTKDACSPFHRLRSDEIWHFYEGDPIIIYELDGDELRSTRLGPDFRNGEKRQHAVVRKTWQAAELCAGGTFALLDTTVSPGFELEDFELGSLSQLHALAPSQSALISRLCKR